MYSGSDEKWVADPVGTQEFFLRPELPLPGNPSQTSATQQGGSAIFNVAHQPTRPVVPGFHYVYSYDVEPHYRTMEGLYSACIQLEGTVNRDGIQTQINPKRYLLVFRYRFHRLTGLRVIELKQ